MLVLQWPASSIEEYDTMIEIENLLIKALPNDDRVDGHDAGSGELNIFIEADDPERTYHLIRSALSHRGEWSKIRIAYRNVEGGPYTVLWPRDLHQFGVA
jgi:hypothetical protein